MASKKRKTVKEILEATPVSIPALARRAKTLELSLSEAWLESQKIGRRGKAPDPARLDDLAELLAALGKDHAALAADAKRLAAQARATAE